MIALALAAALAASPDEEALLEALDAELHRSLSALSLPDSPPVYHLRYKLARLDQLSVVAERGGLVERADAPSSALGVEVRVGDPSWDNTGFGGWQDGFSLRAVPAELTPRSLALDAWRLTDQAFKHAVEQYSRKQAQAVRPPDHPGDYTLTGAVVAEGEEVPLAPRDAVVELATSLSRALGATSGLEVARVDVGHEAGAVWIVDSEGTRVRRPVNELTVRAVAHTLDADGRRLTDDRLWTVRALEDLPPRDALVAELDAMASALVTLRDAPALTDEYVGPVLFEGAAAADLFRWTLLSQLEGTPPEIPFDTFLGDLGDRGGNARLLRRVLPSGWTVVDDPQAAPDHPGAYTHDWEGTPAQAVTLVEDGIVRRLLSTRVPRKGVDGSSGHGRGNLGERAVARASLTTITPAKALPEARLRKLALRAAASYGHDAVLVVRRLQHPALLGLDDPDYFGSDGALPPPVELIRLHADGREERLKGAAFVDVQRWVLRDLVAAGRPVVRDYLSSFDGDDSRLGPTQGTPCRIVAPSVLVGELEVVPVPGDPSAVHALPPP